VKLTDLARRVALDMDGAHSIVTEQALLRDQQQSGRSVAKLTLARAPAPL
jgi:hypothetical protein